ncbi:MAG: dinitrogenase iron-molybdenum cofactor biosynthesis protein [Deltaproteobacteria bacterium]|nr:dinitrogenase iron-molybdenum cofactor biosynthesis protein [Deltaproteobacteria bacterium]
MKKVLLTIAGDHVAPRFDLATDVLIAKIDHGEVVSRKTLVLPAPSAEQMCQLVLSEGADLVVCGGIENEYYQYLNWKGVKVADSVIASFEQALSLAARGALEPGAILLRPNETI